MYAKRKVKSAVNFISDFENTVARYATDEGYDGILCGHIHYCEIKTIDNIIYLNSGDWVESCTAIVEHPCGKLEIINWA
jgi:UDP-2,3-diacylglucosamine pyrophosphatase LpxH